MKKNFLIIIIIVVSFHLGMKFEQYSDIKAAIPSNYYLQAYLDDVDSLQVKIDSSLLNEDERSFFYDFKKEKVKDLLSRIEINEDELPSVKIGLEKGRISFSVLDGIHCMCEGDYKFEFSGDVASATISLHHNEHIRWRNNLWKMDAPLTERSKLAVTEWLKENQIPLTH